MTTAFLRKLKAKLTVGPSLSPDLEPSEHLRGIRKVEELGEVIMEKLRTIPVTTCAASVN